MEKSRIVVLQKILEYLCSTEAQKPESIHKTLGQVFDEFKESLTFEELQAAAQEWDNLEGETHGQS